MKSLIVFVQPDFDLDYSFNGVKRTFCWSEARILYASFSHLDFKE